MASQFNREALVEFAQESIAKGSKSFALASQIFDADTRDRVILFYAWCRKCDDITDGQDHGFKDDIERIGEARSRQSARARIEVLRKKTSAALHDKTTDSPAFDALAIVVKECAIDKQYIYDIIDGFALDADEWRPRTENDLYQYCYHVAGAVGLVMAQIMGIHDEPTLDRACDLGIAFQLANIARDIGEDDSNDRCYLPIDWLVEMDIEPGQHMRPHYRTAMAILSAKLCRASRQYAASSRVGAFMLPFRSRWAILAARRIYVSIADKVLKAGDNAWDQRVFTSKAEKFMSVCAAFFDAIGSVKPLSRNGLWNRPK